MNKQTEYYKLAEKIDNNIDGIWYCCDDLPEIESRKFHNMFCPHLDGSQFFKPLIYAWMGQPFHLSTTKEDNEHRIIALLLMHEMEINP